MKNLTLLNSKVLLTKDDVEEANKNSRVHTSIGSRVYSEGKTQVIFNDLDRSFFDNLVNDIIRGPRRSFNIQFIQQKDLKAKNDEVSLYMMTVTPKERDAISLVDKDDQLAALLSLALKKSKDFKALVDVSEVIRITHLSTPRRYTGENLHESQSRVFSVIITGYPIVK